MLPPSSEWRPGQSTRQPRPPQTMNYPVQNVNNVAVGKQMVEVSSQVQRMSPP